jgi:predicted nucleotidyltransferase
MRTKRGLDALFPLVRKRILALVVLQPNRSWYASELARRLKLPKTSLQRELVNLVQSGILQRRGEGKQVYYQADPDCPILPELQGMMAKTAGLADVVREALAPLAKRISFAFIYGSIARGEELATSDVDLMVVGDAGLSDLAIPLRRVREKLGREVNPTVYSLDEFTRKASQGQHFIRSVLDKPRLFVVGTPNDMERAVGPRTRRAAGG